MTPPPSPRSWSTEHLVTAPAPTSWRSTDYSHDYELTPFDTESEYTPHLVETQTHTTGHDSGGTYSPIGSGTDGATRNRPGRFNFSNLVRWRPPPYKKSRHRSTASTTALNPSKPNARFNGEVAFNEGGWWQRQMLVDRSLRSMAALTSLFALILIIICAVYLGPFLSRPNKNTTSVHRQNDVDCATVERQNVAIHLLINIASTMILGMSNTYQQLASALDIEDIRWALEKKGDARVGTNSPFSINNKKQGKLSSWLAWLLLITTSLPVHFLANSLFGLSTEIQSPSVIHYNATASMYSSSYSGSSSLSDAACWVAFRTGKYLLPQDEREFKEVSVWTDEDSSYYGSTPYYEIQAAYRSVRIDYTSNCTTLRNKTSDMSQVYSERNSTSHGSYIYGTGGCQNGYDVRCFLGERADPSCRLNVRMQAAFILAGCLTIKALYMVLINVRAQRRQKSRILTFGDVIMASILDPSLQIHGECLVNAEEGHRFLTAHTCHKHCRDSEPSPTGDDIGHCQSCKKHNVHNRSADLPHPAIAIKFKKSLLGNLGGTAVTQFITLFLCSMGFLSGMLVLAIAMGGSASEFQRYCSYHENDGYQRIGYGSGSGYGYGTTVTCADGVQKYLAESFGTWGGYKGSSVLASLDPDSLVSEEVAFWVSNGAQLVLSMLYLLVIYNFTLISMEHEWGKFEVERKKLTCTLVRGDSFHQSYIMTLPRRVLFPSMGFMALMHWLLAQSISTQEVTWVDSTNTGEHSAYNVCASSPPLQSLLGPLPLLNVCSWLTDVKVVYAPYPIFLATAVMLGMFGACWWAFTYKREGFMPQMYGSVRACCAATTELRDFPPEGIQWGDLGERGRFNHAGFSGKHVGKIVPAEIYCGSGEGE